MTENLTNIMVIIYCCSVGWFRHFFQPYLSLAGVERLVDCVAQEGMKVLFRFGIAIIASCTEQLLACATVEDVHVTLRVAFASGAIDAGESFFFHDIL